MNHNYIINEKNIALRPIQKDDIELIRHWRNKDDIRKWFTNCNIISKGEQTHWFENYLLKDDEIIFIIEEKTLNQPIGMVSLYDIDNNTKEAQFGKFFIGDITARNFGIGALVTKALCVFAFKQFNLKKIYLEVKKENYPAIKTYQRAGFKYSNASHFLKPSYSYMYIENNYLE